MSVKLRVSALSVSLIPYCPSLTTLGGPVQWQVCHQMNGTPGTTLLLSWDGTLLAEPLLRVTLSPQSSYSHH